MIEQTKQGQLRGAILALDLGEKLVGAAVTDPLQITINRLNPLKRSNWKQLLLDVKHLIKHYDAQTLVIGLPLGLDGTKGAAAEKAERIAANFSRSLSLPVYLQDERLTSVEARAALLARGHKPQSLPELIDGEAAALILRDYLSSAESRIPVSSNTNKQMEGSRSANE
jgi:putative Holliday junction resolvase